MMEVILECIEVSNLGHVEPHLAARGLANLKKLVICEVEPRRYPSSAKGLLCLRHQLDVLVDFQTAIVRGIRRALKY